MSAAHQAIINGANVVLMDKQSFYGGNSTKATSGINGALTNTQIELKIPDSIAQFKEDTLKSAKGLANEELIDVLVNNSAPAVEWLKSHFNLDLSLVSRLGGHSQPRTHRGHDKKFPGMAITFALMDKLEEIAESDSKRFKLLKRCKVVGFLTEKDDDVIGVEYVDEAGKRAGLKGVVIMATGGYAADFDSADSLIKKYRPELLSLPSTNGSHATGDGQKLIIKNGGGDVDMSKVQVHPTGLVPFEQKVVKEDKFLYLGAEALRGEGGIMLNCRGERFCDELGFRDYVSGEMVETIRKTGSEKIFLVLNAKSAGKLEFHVKHYQQRGLMKKMTSTQLLREIGCTRDKLQSEFDKYNDAASVDGHDQFGKKFFPATPFVLENKETNTEESFYVAYISRVVHLTMGGVRINGRAEVLSKAGKPMQGLYAAGELAGGVHGENRLGGSSLLGCVVYGRVAGDSACSYLFRKLSNDKAVSRLKQVSLHIDPMKPNCVVVEWRGESDSSGAVSNSSKALKSPPESPRHLPSKFSPHKPFQIPSKEFTMEEVAKHNTEKDCWVVVKNIVMDVTNFLSDHPGGIDPVVKLAGKDATEAFEMFHEDKVVPKYAAQCCIGRVKGTTPLLEV